MVEGTGDFFKDVFGSDKNSAMLQMMLERMVQGVEKESEKAHQKNSQDIETLFKRVDEVKDKYVENLEKMNGTKTEIEKALWAYERETDKDLTRVKVYMTIITFVSSIFTGALVQFFFHRAVGR